MNRPLTHQQQAVYDMIRDRIVSRGYGPTVREIGQYMNIKSPNGVMCHLRALERKGMILRSANKSRAIELTEPISNLVGGSLPSAGAIAGGVCHWSSEPPERLNLSRLAAAGRSFLRVQDDSLQAAHICSGDLLIIHKQSQAAHGQLALVRDPAGTTLVGYLSSEYGNMRLQPVAADQPNSLVSQPEVLGVIVGVIRNYGG